MKKLIRAICVILLPLTLAACGNRTAAGEPEENDPVASPVFPPEKQTETDEEESREQREEAEQLQIRVQGNGDPVIFLLNDSAAARAFYEQLPLTTAAEDYGDNEKIVYPPEELDIGDTPAAEGGAGTLAYYAPWGDVVMFYGEFESSSGLYGLGTAVSGIESIEALTGEVRIEPYFEDGPDEEPNQTGQEHPNPDDMASDSQDGVTPENGGEEKAIKEQPETGIEEKQESRKESKQTETEQESRKESKQTETEQESRKESKQTEAGQESRKEEKQAEAEGGGSHPEEKPTEEKPESEPSETEPENGPEEEKGLRPEADGMFTVQAVVGDQVFSVRLYDNETTNVLLELLPMTLDMNELNGNEKYHYFSDGLPMAARNQAEIRSGDLMLYGSDCLVLFYESFSTSYSYTPLGYVEDASGLAEALGSGDVRIVFRVNEEN